MSDLAQRFRRLIAAHGPMPVSRFMGESNALYYASRDPLGAPKPEGGGDFVTAPDISQMFGEMVGAWLADIWQRASGLADAIYVELGPGRGTLAVDALRVMWAQGLEPRLHLVEGSPKLRTVQAERLGDVVHHDDLSTVPDDRPLLVVANEFLDALPIRQIVRTADGWRERMVALDGEDFVFAAGPQPMDVAVPAEFADAKEGTVIETSPGAASVVEEVAGRLARQGGVALLIDYGHLVPRTGSTLQAIRDHEKVDALACPGEADLTAHVDFPTLAQVAQKAGAQWLTATTQGNWLGALGIAARARVLGAAGDAAAVERDLRRLVHPDEMGDLFKVIAIGGGDWPPGAGFS